MTWQWTGHKPLCNLMFRQSNVGYIYTANSLICYEKQCGDIASICITPMYGYFNCFWHGLSLYAHVWMDVLSASDWCYMMALQPMSSVNPIDIRCDRCHRAGDSPAISHNISHKAVYWHHIMSWSILGAMHYGKLTDFANHTHLRLCYAQQSAFFFYLYILFVYWRSSLTYWPWEMWLLPWISNFQTLIKVKYIEHFMWNCPQVHATRPDWW